MTDRKPQPQDPPAANIPTELDEAELAQATGGTTPSVSDIPVTKHTDTTSPR